MDNGGKPKVVAVPDPCDAGRWRSHQGQLVDRLQLSGHGPFLCFETRTAPVSKNKISIGRRI